MKKQCGNIGIFCLLISLGLLTLTWSTYQLLVADYKNLKVEIRQQQLFQITNSLMDCLNGCLETDSEIKDSWELDDAVEQEKIKVTVNLMQQKNVVWLSVRASSGACYLNIIKALAQPPEAQSVFYNYNAVARQINLSSTAIVNKQQVAEYYENAPPTTGENSGLPQIKTAFLNFDIKNYAKYAFLFPTAETLEYGLANNIFFDEQGAIYYFPPRQTVCGAGLFARRGDILLGRHTYFPDQLIIISNGNIVLEEGVNVAQGLLIAGGNIELAKNVKFRGKIFARNRLSIASGVELKDINTEQLIFRTNKYLW